jgi:exosortase
MDNVSTQPAARPDMLRLFAPAALVAAVFLWLFRGSIVTMADRWSDPTFSHGWIVLPAALVIAWYKRDTWLGTPARPCFAGLAVILAGLALMVVGAWADVQFAPWLAMFIVLGGILLYIGGVEWFKKLLFPYAFLFFMVPWPDFLVEIISFPMQIATSAYSAILASIVGVPVLRDGVNLHIWNAGHTGYKASFEVAVACSGMHSLVALLCLAAGVAYFTPVAMWKRWLLFMIGLPMAFAANIFRVFLILCVGNWISPDLAATAFHDYSAPVLFLLNTMGLLAIRNAMLREPKPAPAPVLAGGGALPRGGDDDAY